MINKFKNWYCRNYDAITWFLIGFLVADALSNLAKGDFTNAAIASILAFANYYFNKKC